jgi:DNA-binding NarL/FixJ family response regulator
VAESALDLHTDRILQEGVASLAAVPLADPKGGLGVLCVGTREIRRFSDAEIRLLTGLAGLAAAALGRARLASRLDQTEEELRNRERLSSLGMLAAEVAHEVRNPLAVVRMLWHSAVRGLPASEAQTRDLQMIETKLGQMNTILDRILNLARSADPEMREVDAAEVVEEVALLTRTKLGSARIRAVLKLPPRGTARIRGDRSLLEQALLNLVLNGMEATRQLRERGYRRGIVMISMHNERHLVRGTREAGADAYVLKEHAFEQLPRAIAAASRREAYFSPQIGELDGETLGVTGLLTPREREVLQMLAEGATAKEIAFALKISSKTVDVHRANLQRKLNAGTLADLTRIAVREGIAQL